MNLTLQRMMAARGDGTMGDFDPNNPGAATRPRVVGTLPTVTPPSGHSTLNTWASVITTLGSQAIQAFARNPTYPQQQIYSAQQLQAIQQAQMQQSGALVSGGVTNTGLQIGGTSISWPMIALGVGAILLLQARPLSR